MKAIHFLIPLGSTFCVLIANYIYDANIQNFCNMQKIASNWHIKRAGGGAACAPPTDRNQEGAGGPPPATATPRPAPPPSPNAPEGGSGGGGRKAKGERGKG